MSYDIELCVKVEGLDKYVRVAEPEYANPTYNLREMFVACMDWDYKQSVVYPVKEVLPKIEHGISELSAHTKKYKKYEPANGWGDIVSAFKALKSLEECINYTVYEYPQIPIEHLYMRW